MMANLSSMSKDMQIEFLKEKLDFTVKQLEEKDRQLEHYKGLVTALKDVLSEVTGRQQQERKLSSSGSSQPPKSK